MPLPTPLALLCVLAVALALACPSAASGDGDGERHKYVIMGGGPAGLQLAYFMKRAGRDFVLLEKGSGPGTFFTWYPRHRMLISINKVEAGSEDVEFRLRHDWNSLLPDPTDPTPPLLFSNFSQAYFPPADRIVDYFHEFLRVHGLAPHIRYDSRVVSVDREARNTGDFIVTARTVDKDTKEARDVVYRAPVVVDATGMSNTTRFDFPGAEHIEYYEHMDPSKAREQYKGKRILIIGTGNSAFETANNLTEVAHMVHVCNTRGTVELAYHTHYPGHLRAINLAFLDTYQHKSQNAIRWCALGPSTVIARLPDGTLELTPMSDGSTPNYREADRRLNYDHIISTAGFLWDSSIYRGNVRPRTQTPMQYPNTPYFGHTLTGRHPAASPRFEALGVPGLYVAGTLMAGRDKKKTAIPFIHGFRYAVRALFNILETTYEGGKWPGESVENTPEALAASIIERAQYSSGLYQLFNGFLCEVYWFNRNASTPHYVHEREMPCDMIFTSPVYAQRDFFTVSLEFNPEFGKPGELQNTLALNRVHKNLGADTGYYSNFLHPVIRYFSPRDPRYERFRLPTAMELRLAEESSRPENWMGYNHAPTAIATHHMMESPLIDFQDPILHVEPLVRYFAGLIATRPELMPEGAVPPTKRVVLRENPQPAHSTMDAVTPDVLLKAYQEAKAAHAEKKAPKKAAHTEL